MKILVVNIEDWEKEILQKELPNDELIFLDENLTMENVNKVADCEALATFIFSKVTKEIIDQMPNLKLITTMSTGFEHIDTEYCKEKGIIVSNVPTYGENTVAEHALALLLAISRKIYPSIKRTRQENEFKTDASLRGFDLKGKTIGILGAGHIGIHMARMCIALDMKVICYDPFPKHKLAEQMGFEWVSFEKLIADSKIISLHVPDNEHTHHMINKDVIEKMQNGVIIINTARGGLIDTHALAQGLDSGKIGGAGLDVLEDEGAIEEEVQLLKKEHHESWDHKTFLENHILMHKDNVLITPHNGFNSEEALKRILDTTIDNIRKYQEGNSQNLI